jgi:hypothetical protein
MGSWDDVNRLAMALPEVEKSTTFGGRSWKVAGKSFVWERPLRKADLQALGDDAPQGSILGARTDGEEEKFALIAEDPDVYFTTPHFNGYPAILVQLDHIELGELEELITEAWLVQAPKRLAKEHHIGESA